MPKESLEKKHCLTWVSNNHEVSWGGGSDGDQEQQLVVGITVSAFSILNGLLIKKKKNSFKVNNQTHKWEDYINNINCISVVFIETAPFLV